LAVGRLHALDGGQGKTGESSKLALTQTQQRASSPHLLRRDHDELHGV